MKAKIKFGQAIKIVNKINGLYIDDNRSLAIAWDGEGNVSLINLITGQVDDAILPCPASALSIHPSLPIIAATALDGSSLFILDSRPSNLSVLASLVPRGGRPEGTEVGFHSCLFSQDGEHLWAALRRDDERIEVYCYQAKDFSAVDHTTISDPLGDGWCFTFRTPDPNRIGIWQSAGQNGQRVYWVSKTGSGLSAEEEPFLEDCGAPAFSPNGNELLAVEDLERLCKFPYPISHKIGCWKLSKRVDDGLNMDACYISEKEALACSFSGRIFIIDVRKMKLISEVNGIALEDADPVDLPLESAGGHEIYSDSLRFYESNKMLLLCWDTNFYKKNVRFYSFLLVGHKNLIGVL